MIVGLSRSDGRNMWHGVAWLIGCLMVLWSLGAWALHTVVQWAAGFAGAKAANQVGARSGRPNGWLHGCHRAHKEQWGAAVSTFTPWVDYAVPHAPSLVRAPCTCHLGGLGPGRHAAAGAGRWFECIDPRDHAP